MLPVVLFFLSAIGVAVILYAIDRRKPHEATWPLYSKKPLSNPEQVLYHRIVKAMPECIVLAQVQMSRIIGVRRGFNLGQWNNRINRMSLDYVVCLKDSTVVAAIELDDSSHHGSHRREADAKKQKALSSAGITLIRWQVSSLPDELTIRRALTG